MIVTRQSKRQLIKIEDGWKMRCEESWLVGDFMQCNSLTG